jgi:cell division protein FtsL
MMYRDNTAYDFEMFSPKKKVVELPVSAPSKKRTSSAKKTAAQPAKRSSVLAIGAVAIAFLLIIAQLHCQLKNSEVVDQIYQTEKAIETLQSENTRLQVELDGKVSFSNMENTAKSMGMQKITVAQMEYVNLCTEDTIEVNEGNGGLLAMLGEWF